MKKIICYSTFFLAIAAIAPAHGMRTPSWLFTVLNWIPERGPIQVALDGCAATGEAAVSGAIRGALSNREAIAAAVATGLREALQQLDPNELARGLNNLSPEARVVLENIRGGAEALSAGLTRNVAEEIRRQLPEITRHLSTEMNAAIQRASRDMCQELNRQLPVATRNMCNEINNQLPRATRSIWQEINNQLPRTAKIALVTFAAGLTCRLLFRKYESYLFKPRFITKDARTSLLGKITDKLRKHLFGKPKERLQPMIFSDAMEKRLTTLSQTTREIHKRIKKVHKDIYYQNLFFFGPPGTGKSMYAEQLAHKAGMEYIVVSGSSFSMLNIVDALSAMDDLFGDANGLCIIIDEAHKLFSSTARTSEDDEKIINHFQMHTGTPNNKFMVIMTANYKTMNEAIASRIDEFVEFKKPDADVRFHILKLYRDRMFFSKKNSAELKESAEEFLANVFLQKIAEQTEGLAPRELSKLMNSIKAASLKEGALTLEIVDNAVKQMKEKYQTLHIESRAAGARV